jgi:hypothetical protein
VEIKTGQIWKLKNSNRPPVSINSYNVYNKTVYWNYLDGRDVFESAEEYFLNAFEWVSDE